jgi:signal transduction histidine kinase
LLIVEDSEKDAALVARHLQKEGYAPSYLRVDTAEAMRAALAEQPWDLVIADYAMPTLDGLGALELLKESGLDLPFILVSGVVADDTAVAVMRAGAHDYLAKDRLARLAPAVKRELREAEVRRDRRRTADGLRFLADASAALAESLDYDTTLSRVARLAVPFLADACAVHVLEGAERLRLVAAAHADPAEEAALRDRWERRPIAWSSTDPTAVALRAGEPRFVVEAPGDGGDGHGRLAWAPGFQAAMIIPLVARRRSLGTITLFSDSGGRTYGPVDFTLAQDLGRRAAIAVDNARLYQQARDAIRARDTFLACVAHEVKTPLTRLKLHLDIALRAAERREDARSQGPATQRIERAGAEVAALAKLVDEMIGVSRLDTSDHALRLSDVDLGALAREIAARLEPETAAAGCDLTVRGDDPVTGTWDRGRLDAIVTSLLRNAIKYGAGKPVELAVEGGDGSARLVVKDQGIGIAPEDQGRIFERFERAVSGTHYSGFGLGLWAAREAALALDGTIRVESAPGAGATFTVELPRAGPAARAACEA